MCVFRVTQFRKVVLESNRRIKTRKTFERFYSKMYSVIFNLFLIVMSHRSDFT